MKRNNGPMGAFVEQYIDYRRRLGFRVADDKDGEELRSFGCFADQCNHRGAITTALAVRWAKAPKRNTPRRAAQRLRLLQGLMRYQRIFNPAVEVPQPGLLGPARYDRVSPHIFSDQQIAALCHSARLVRPRQGLRPQTYAALFGLLVCTGMRVSEAIHLNADDVDLKAGLVTVRWSKFGRSRVIPLQSSAVSALRAYRDFCSNHLGEVPSAFFVNETGMRMRYHQIRMTFARIRRKHGWVGSATSRRPRIHDLRHTFAVRCILRWYQEGACVDQRMPALATYLGHVNVTKTYWYLTGVPELMAIVSKRFEDFASSAHGGAL